MSTLTAILHENARRGGGRTALTALDRHGDVSETLTVGELDAAARSLATALLADATPGDRVLLPPMPGLRFHVAFLACLYAGLVAVPVPAVPLGAVPAGRSGLSRLLALCADATPTAIVVPGALVPELTAAWDGDPVLGALRIVAAELRAEAGPLPEPGELAFLQYTSGSTSVPRGVMLSHAAIVANQAAVFERMGVTPESTLVSWLPLYHDMGLCLGLLQPVYAGVPAIVLAPETFLVRPESWLRASSGLPDVRTAAPDFAYAWCARRVKDTAKAGLDLSGWKAAVNGAEPVRAATIRAFSEAFAGCGLDPRALTPSYGLAEATLFVTGGSGTAEPTIRRYRRDGLTGGLAIADPDGLELTGSGTRGNGIEVAIADPVTGRRLAERETGEIWVRSPAAGLGYWGRPAESLATFGAALDGEPGWLRTGDLGFLDTDGELFVTGRHKDLIIVAGVNYHPHDFELIAQQSHPLLDGGLAAAVCVSGDNRVTVLAEAVRRPSGDEAADAAAAAVRAVTAVLPVATDVVVTARGQLPRTTSGKVRRAECADRLRDGRITALAHWPRALPGKVPS